MVDEGPQAYVVDPVMVFSRFAAPDALPASTTSPVTVPPGAIQLNETVLPLTEGLRRIGALAGA